MKKPHAKPLVLEALEEYIVRHIMVETGNSIKLIKKEPLII